MENFEYPCLLVNSTLQEQKLCLVQIMNMLLLKFETKNQKIDFIVDTKPFLQSVSDSILFIQMQSCTCSLKRNLNP